jgi:hypothetical protein
MKSARFPVSTFQGEYTEVTPHRSSWGCCPIFGETLDVDHDYLTSLNPFASVRGSCLRVGIAIAEPHVIATPYRSRRI